GDKAAPPAGRIAHFEDIDQAPHVKKEQRLEKRCQPGRDQNQKERPLGLPDIIPEKRPDGVGWLNVALLAERVDPRLEETGNAGGEGEGFWLHVQKIAMP